jgi:cysteine desulfurase/selenocysteine lyase
MEKLREVLREGGVRLVFLPHASNVIGTITPIAEIAELVHAHGAYLVVDGSQIVAHRKINVAELGCDGYAFSSHKLYGPTGVGALYLNPRLVESLPPFELGGGMVGKVSEAETTFASAPYRFEAGTPPIAEAVGFARAIEFVEQIGLDAIVAYERELEAYMLKSLQAVEGLTLYGNPRERVGTFAFNLEGIHPHDAGTLMDSKGVAVRVGHHCAQPLMNALGIAASIRASLGLYNQTQDIDALVDAIRYTQSKFRHV